MKTKVHITRSSLFYQILVLVFLLSCTKTAFAQKSNIPLFSPEKHITAFSIDTWGTEEGLQSKSLLFLEQTNDGYLWISSFQGLIRFDGINFQVFNTKNTPQAFKANSIKDLFEQKDGTLNIGTSRGGLIIYKNGAFQNLPFHTAIQTSFFDKPNHAWIGTKTQGVYELNDTTFTHYDTVSALNDIWIFNIFQDEAKNTWFATEGNGVVKIDKNGKSAVFTTNEGLASNKAYSIFQNSKKQLLVGTKNGLCLYENGKMQVVNGTAGFSINRIIEDYYGSLWMASNRGILRLNAKTKKVEVLTEKNGLPHKNIQDILQDNEGNIWFASYRAGLGRIKDAKFSNYTEKNGLVNKSVSAIHEVKENHYLVATDAGIINEIKDNKITVFKTKKDLSKIRLKHLNSDSKGNVLISTYSGLLTVKPNGREEFMTMKDGLPGNQTRMTLEDHLGNIWIGTRANGLVKKAPNGKLSFYNKANHKLSSNFVMSLHQDKKNNLLVGNNNTGLDIIDFSDGNFKITNYDDELSSKLIFNTYDDDDNVIWIVTNGGLDRLENKKITKYSSKNGLLVDVCFDILEDDLGYFWITTSEGVVKVKKQELNDLAKGKIQHLTSAQMFGTAEGMIAKECTGAAFSIKTKEGKIMIPTLGGITYTDPTNSFINKVKPIVNIEKLVVDNKEVNINKKIAFEPNQQRFIFGFTALNFTAPEKVSFKYKLENYDKDWIISQGERQAIYTGLPYGEYSFRVIAANNDGIWNEEGDSITFTIAPHIYETPLFYIVIFILLMLIIYSIYNARIKSVKRKNEELEVLVKERTFEITSQKEELLSQQEELITQKDKIEEQNENLELAYNDINMLSNIGREITATLNFEELNKILYDNVNKLMKTDSFGVGTYNSKNNTLDFNYSIENGELLPFLAESLNTENSFAVKCFKNNEIVFVQDVEKEAFYKSIGKRMESKGQPSNALIYVPLLFENKVVGVITVQSFEKNVYKKQHITILETLASYISIALENANSYTVIQDKNEQITDSIRYAERIQQAILPSEKNITDTFADSFVHFSPKDIVSGDFYWLNQIDGKTFVAVVDCTGHGVPGAFMSMIGMASLNEIVNKEQIYAPADILNALHKKIRISLRQDQTSNNDGMDVALCLLEENEDKTVQLTFAGAKRPLYYSENGELQELKGNTKSIGGFQKEQERIFKEHKLTLQKGASIYIFSDGIIDQNNPNRARFGTPKLKEILQKNISNSLKEQKENILNALKNHQQEDPQRDDIVMVGIRF